MSIESIKKEVESVDTLKNLDLMKQKSLNEYGNEMNVDEKINIT